MKKDWQKTLNEVIGKSYACENFWDDIICVCPTESTVYFGDFKKKPFHSTEFIEVYTENENGIVLEVLKDNNNEKIEIVDGYLI